MCGFSFVRIEPLPQFGRLHCWSTEGPTWGPRIYMCMCGTFTSSKFTEYFGAQEVDIYFLNNIFSLKGNCVLRTLKNSFAIFLA